MTSDSVHVSPLLRSVGQGPVLTTWCKASLMISLWSSGHVIENSPFSRQKGSTSCTATEMVKHYHFEYYIFHIMTLFVWNCVKLEYGCNICTITTSFKITYFFLISYACPTSSASPKTGRYPFFSNGKLEKEAITFLYEVVSFVFGQFGIWQIV